MKTSLTLYICPWSILSDWMLHHNYTSEVMLIIQNNSLKHKLLFVFFMSQLNSTLFQKERNGSTFIQNVILMLSLCWGGFMFAFTIIYLKSKHESSKWKSSKYEQQICWVFYYYCCLEMRGGGGVMTAIGVFVFFAYWRSNISKWYDNDLTKWLNKITWSCC